MAIEISCCSFLQAQNLVANPSLENYANNKINYWSSISGSPDIASKNNQIVFSKTSGTFNPYFSAFISTKLDTIQFGEICLCQGFNSEWSEVTQVELVTPLKRNKEYEISLYTIKNDAKLESINEISVLLTRKPLAITSMPFNYSAEYTSLKYEDGLRLNSKDFWIKVTGRYKANGREKYLSIGNFSGANQSFLARMKGVGHSLYYCFDNFEVVELSEKEVFSSKKMPSFETNLTEAKKEILLADSLKTESFIIKNSYFDFDSYELSKTADSLFQQLVDNIVTSDLKSIKIIGHTDNIGNEEYNKKLSEMRALSVKNKLIELGVSSEIIKFEGKGAMEPIADNSTPDGRSKNRRVEIIVSRNE